MQPAVLRQSLFPQQQVQRHIPLTEEKVVLIEAAVEHLMLTHELEMVNRADV